MGWPVCARLGWHLPLVGSRLLGLGRGLLGPLLSAAPPSEAFGTPVRPMTPNLLTPTEAARILHVHPGTLRRWVADGRLTATRTLGGHYRYRAADIRSIRAGR
jgi:excisionase family DNA binding protein